MKVEKLKDEMVEDFIEYCKKYRENPNDGGLSDVDLENFEINKENPTYMLMDDNNIKGAVSLILDDFYKQGRIGRLRIFHSIENEVDNYKIMLRAILEEIEGIDKIFIYIDQKNEDMSEILTALQFKLGIYSFTMIREDKEVSKATFPEGFELRIFKENRDEVGWCKVRNIGFPEDPPRTPENVCLYWESYPQCHLEGGMMLLYYNEEPIGTIRASVESETGEAYTYISVVCVNPEYRGKGLGRNLLRAAIDYGRSKGMSKAMLCVDIENESALNLYLREGFTKYKARVEYEYKLT
ncbi:GNAT family N-acetyltransferase [Clostridium sp. UBA6640]|uniref:GNAT family N-acetyltransferase n=1 Tax=Clostridium sp. UBA6640 TaxID=1946370 RepID=UPI0025B84080|nr:GNAT family N-acetyltransferase [Clostridium sp. UBA6640]